MFRTLIYLLLPLAYSISDGDISKLKSSLSNLLYVLPALFPYRVRHILDLDKPLSINFLISCLLNLFSTNATLLIFNHCHCTTSFTIFEFHFFSFKKSLMISRTLPSS